MKRTLYCLLTRALLILPLVWMMYALSVLLLTQNWGSHLGPSDKLKAQEILALPRDLNMATHPAQNDEKLRGAAGAGAEVFPTLRQWLDKLAEMGGRLVDKRSKFVDVALPPFNDKRDPTGPGENGAPVIVDKNRLSKEDSILHGKGWAANKFNQYVSDRISVHRSLPKSRNAECKAQEKEYGKYLQTLSVIIIFHNEAWTVLLRSVHSILSRTPEHLLKEIILVDDFSTQAHLQTPLEKYFHDFPKVQIVRATKRQGLTRARLLGYFVSTSPIVVFLDSHIECFPGWAEPLVSRISQNPTTVVFPSIEVINDENFATMINNFVNQNGIFQFKDLTFQWQSIPQEEMRRRRNNADPIRSPTMPGGLFAISREFFDRLGTYDPGLDYWGGENIELSFKAWMCGGRVEMIPCSHIGHIFRSDNPIKWTHNIGSKNAIRVAEVWMDDYRNYFYERFLYKFDEYGDVTDRKELRKKLNCQNFEWYLRNVCGNMLLPSNVEYAGEIRSVASPQCVDSMGGPEVNEPAPKMYPCHGLGFNQFWYLSEDGGILHDSWHICADDGKVTTKGKCNSPRPIWQYRKTHLFKNGNFRGEEQMYIFPHGTQAKPEPRLVTYGFDGTDK